jgi:hypothetical protein
MARGKRAARVWHAATAFSAAAFLWLLAWPPGCAVMSSNDCADKASCPDIDASAMTADAALDGVVAESNVDAVDEDANASDATMADSVPDDVAVDAMSDDRTLSDSAPDSASDDADGAPDVGADVASDGAEDGSPDVGADAAGDGPAACDGHNPDCSNPTCQPAFACIPAVPAGWTGPTVLFDATSAGAPAPAAAPCPASPQYANDAYDGHASPFPEGTCSCTCGAASATCGGPTVTVYQDSQCASACVTVPNVSACAKGCASSTALSAAVTANPAPSGGSCPASVVNAIVPWNPATGWTTTGRACGASRTVGQGGCAANQVCADAPPSSTLQAWCVYQSGIVSCPAGYPQQHVYFAGGSDARTCTGTCTCGSPTGVTCTIQSVSVSATSDCAAPATFASTAINQCNGNLAATARNVTASVSASGGQCAASGSAAVAGAVTPDTPTSVCCTE